jgi:hypothetical protein
VSERPLATEFTMTFKQRAKALGLAAALMTRAMRCTETHIGQGGEMLAPGSRTARHLSLSGRRRRRFAWYTASKARLLLRCAHSLSTRIAVGTTSSTAPARR